jgi:hypothetical protein
LDFPFPHIATGDFDIPIVGQLTATNLSFSNEFEPGSVKVVRFEAAFRCGGVWKQDLKYALGNAHHALIFAHADAELDDGALGVPVTGASRFRVLGWYPFGTCPQLYKCKSI